MRDKVTGYDEVQKAATARLQSSVEHCSGLRDKKSKTGGAGSTAVLPESTALEG